ncbi:MAG: hypothetical protein SCALA702_32800 [Melioribacteraceae bacterium]|nr:MAG: hypothetical protein SCALA702_32800 [Melioribacteraceae bacterium]
MKKTITFLLLLFSAIYSQSSYVISETETWSADKTFNTNVIVESGGKLIIESGVTVGFHWADINADGFGDFKLQVKNGGKIVIRGKTDSPVIFTPVGDPAPEGSENKHWQGIVLDSSATSSDSLYNFQILNSWDGFTIGRPGSIYGVTIQNGVTGITVEDFSSESRFFISGVLAKDLAGKGIIVNQSNTTVQHTIVDSAVTSGIEINADNVSIDWCEIKNINGTGIFNSASGTDVEIQNTIVEDCDKSGLFNLDGSINRVHNCLFSGNAFHGVVNSSGYLWIQQSEISNNDSLGFIAAGDGTTLASYVNCLGNTGRGFFIMSERLDSDMFNPVGVIEDATPEVEFINSNIYGNDFANNIQVASTAPATPQADFTQNWWGQTSGIADLVSFTIPGSIDYTNWRLNGTVSSTSPSFTKSLAIFDPEDGAIFIEGQQIQLQWVSRGLIQNIQVEIRDASDVLVAEKSKVVANTGSYTFKSDTTTRKILIKSYPEGDVSSSQISIDFATDLQILTPIGGPVVLGGDSLNIKWLAPADTVISLQIALDGDDANPNNWTWETIEGAEALTSDLGYFKYYVPNMVTAYNTARIQVIDTAGVMTPAISDLFTIRPTPPRTSGGTWAYNNQTGHNMTVMFNDINVVDDQNPANNIITADEDIYVGAFYLDNTKGLTCVGYKYHRFNFDSTNSVLLTVWGDDPTTSDVTEGVPEGKSLIFKIWRTVWSQDDPEDEIHPADINDRSAIPSFTPIVYFLNGAYEIEKLTYQRESEDPVIVNPDGVHKIASRNGWSYVSSYIKPDVTNLAFSVTGDDNILSPPVPESSGGINQGIFPEVTDFIMLKNAVGNVYWITDVSDPNNPEITADLTSWNYKEGYYMLFNNSENLDTLQLSGTELVPENEPLQLSLGWNLIPYLRKNNMPLTLALNSIIDNIIILKNQDGEVYWPDQGINEVGDLIVGQAYLVKLRTADILTYPPNSVISKLSVSNEPLGKRYFNIDFNSTNSSVIGIPKFVVEEFLSPGDEIAVVRSNGEICGSTVYDNNNMAVTVWGQYNSESGGFIEGEPYRLRIWSAAEEEEIAVVEVEISSGEFAYSNNGITVLSKIEVVGENIPDDFVLSQNYPNPFNPETKISFGLPEKSNVKISVYNLLGQKVAKVVEGEFNPGYHEVNFNGSELSSGVYFYRLEAANFVRIKKMMLLK